ncbi:MAG: tonB-system energizer ExbB [Pseudomonadota bacterium]|nr:tonB-system energizer ExbB [Pseudomonadota bacterium]
MKTSTLIPAAGRAAAWLSGLLATRLFAQDAALAHDVLPQNLSPWGMFLDADLVVKIVMVGLALASLATWTVLVAKTVELRATLRRQHAVFGAVNAARTLADAEDAARRADLFSDLLAAARSEWNQSADALHDGDGLKERIASRLDRLESAASRRMTRGTGVLATIGATAPFVGLFGTVWGIMNSFIGISRAQTTNLAIVAPGIAEALLATAIGLIAAIPAVVIYNHFSRRIAVYRALLGDTAAAVLRLISRDLSRQLTSVRGTLHAVERN